MVHSGARTLLLYVHDFVQQSAWTLTGTSWSTHKLRNLYSNGHKGCLNGKVIKCFFTYFPLLKYMATSVFYFLFPSLQTSIKKKYKQTPTIFLYNKPPSNLSLTSFGFSFTAAFLIITFSLKTSDMGDVTLIS